MHDIEEAVEAERFGISELDDTEDREDLEALQLDLDERHAEEAAARDVLVEIMLVDGVLELAQAGIRDR